MSGKLIDTNILIYLSKKQLQFDDTFSPEDELFISVITYMEVMGYKFSGNSEKRTIEKLCGLFPVIDLNKNIVETVIELRRKSKIKLPDAIILATAVVYNLKLVTANVSDFKNLLPKGKIINPMH